MKFQVGDIVVGNELANEYYAITKSGVQLEVMEIHNESFRGRPIHHTTGSGFNWLDYDHFDLKDSYIQENE